MHLDQRGLTEGDFLRGVLALGLLFIIIGILSPVLRYKGRLVNDRQGLEFLWTNAKKRFQSGARGILDSAFKKHNNAFYMVTDNGVEMILNPKYAHEIRNDERFSISLYNEQSFHGKIAGFEMFQRDLVADELFIISIRNKLTRSLGRLLEPISSEVENALQSQWTDNKEWHSIALQSTILSIIAQQSSRVFLGDQLCRNPDWIRITVNHTVNFFMAVEALRVWPHFLRPLAAKFLPISQRLRAEIQEAWGIITPILDKRRAQKAVMLEQGKDQEKFDDLLEWMEDLRKDTPYDPARAQLKVSVAAIHTTSDLLTQTLFNLCGHPELIKDLREEVISTVGTHGWEKSAIYNLKLMDSVLKETQRLKPITLGPMVRVAVDDVKLSDGLEIPKGTKTLVSCHNMRDSRIYPEAGQFNGYRFYELRKVPGQEHSAQLVSTSANHFAFGHGKHACPGRFFAATEVKVALCHILLKYDFRLAGNRPAVIEHGVAQYANPWGQIDVKRRDEEISL